MQKFSVYLKLECKRILKLFPGMIIVTMLVLSVCAIFLLQDTKSSSSFKNSSSGIKTINIGIVYSDEDKQFLGLGFYMLEHADDIGYICKFKEVSLDEGQRLLDNKQLDVLAIFPKDYVRSVYYGIDKPISIRFGTAQSGISSLLFKQLSETVSDYMMDSKAGVYAMQDMYDSWDLDYSFDADELSEKYVMRILDRTAMIKKDTIDATDGLSSTMYYVCVGIVLVLLFWGLNCGSVLGKNQKMLSALLQRQQLSGIKQYFARYLSLLFLFTLNYIAIATASYIATSKMQIDFISAGSYIKLIPLLFLLCAVVLCVYEISNDGIGGMIFFFFSSLIMGFVSGFFYPLSYFPTWMQSVAEFLPTRIMFEYTTACIKNNLSYGVFVKLILYTVLFIVITLVFSMEEFRFIPAKPKNRRLS